MALYETILLEKLLITPEFFDDRRENLREKLYNAAEDMKLENGDIFAINQCLHLASSIVLQFAPHLSSTLNFIRQSDPRLQDKDPATVLTVAALYYLLEREAASQALLPEDKAKIEQLYKRFDEMKWLIGQDAMGALGFKKKKAAK